MKEEIVLKERIRLMEKEIATLTDKLESTEKSLREVGEIINELKALKLFLGRAFPDFKTKYPEIVQKVFRKT